jgi:hypothetical protein
MLIQASPNESGTNAHAAEEHMLQRWSGCAADVLISYIQSLISLCTVFFLADGFLCVRPPRQYTMLANRLWAGTHVNCSPPVRCFGYVVILSDVFWPRAVCLLLLACTGCALAADQEKKEEKLGTVIGIDLGTTCARPCF